MANQQAQFEYRERSANKEESQSYTITDHYADHNNNDHSDDCKDHDIAGVIVMLIFA